MLRSRLYQLIIKVLCITFLTSFILSSCSREKEYLITDTSDYSLVGDLMRIHGKQAGDNKYSFTEDNLKFLLNDLKVVLEVYECNFNNYIYGSNIIYYNVAVENGSIDVKESSDFRYVWKPDDKNAISDGPYKGYIKQPYIDPVCAIQEYARIISFYKALCIYIEKIDSSYLSNYYRFEYLNDFYSDGIAAKIKG